LRDVFFFSIQSQKEYLNTKTDHINIMQNINEPDVLIKLVKPIGDGGHTVLPKKWIGKQVKITLIDQTEGVSKE
jgi:putative transposon-encoded protein